MIGAHTVKKISIHWYRRTIFRKNKFHPILVNFISEKKVLSQKLIIISNTSCKKFEYS